MPLYVRAGSIVPLGPVVQYADEKRDADWTIRIYPGADGAFTVYEDGGDGYAYENGEFATWTLAWNDAKSTLCIGAREGTFAGMVATRSLHVVVVGRQAACEDELTCSQTIRYTGKRIEVNLHMSQIDKI
jgi:alpha-D-xyloside xylohydrolase